MGKFTYLHKKIKKVMSFKFNHVDHKKELQNKDKIGENSSVSKKEVDENISISKKEVEILLQMIKNSHFSGDMLENLYTLVFKLQKHYNKLK
tara:strand:- start:553 stop:828 length:276 start_codon:yes stop_codon:yes gene_type:complete